MNPIVTMKIHPQHNGDDVIFSEFLFPKNKTEQEIAL